jgi:hypothetical protein
MTDEEITAELQNARIFADQYTHMALAMRAEAKHCDTEEAAALVSASAVWLQKATQVLVDAVLLTSPVPDTLPADWTEKPA